MSVYKKEFDILKKAEFLARNRFPRLGVNKKREILRLLYEISKKENLSPQDILQGQDLRDFAGIKGYLLKRRFPYSYSHNEIPGSYLCKIELNSEECANLNKKEFYPKRIFIEKQARNSHLAGRFRKAFPESEFSEIKSLKDYIKGNERLKIRDYNHRFESLFIVNENYDFFKKCPCTKRAVGCGYHIFNLGFGCLFDCTYCYLQEYINSPGISFPANMDTFFDNFNSYKKPGMRIGSGEFSDSLMLDHVTEYSVWLIDFFKNHKNITFEFKTKSTNIKNLLKADHAGNIVVSWSLNPQGMIDENELFTPSLNERIEAALKCAQAGYRIGIHFDPVFHYEGWQRDYENVVEALFDKIKPEDIAWISVGTLRFKPELKTIIERRFPQNKILDEELAPGYDHKLRYPYSIRYNIYKYLMETLHWHSGKLPIYLCMEEKSMWRDLNLRLPRLR